MEKDVTLSTRVSSGLRDEINKDAEEAGISQAEWLRSAAESYLAAGGNQADLLMLTPEDKLQIIQNHIEEIEDFNNDLDEDDKDYDNLLDDLNYQLDNLLDQVNDCLDDCVSEIDKEDKEEEDDDEDEDEEDE